ncbi:MAG: hypothetical protein U1F67_22325 [Rubrivivax sp.]
MHVAGVEHLAQAVARQLDDRLEIQLRSHALLDRIDRRQLGRALFGLLLQAQGRSSMAAFGRFAAQALQSRRGQRRQRGQEIALGLGEAAEGTFDVGVEHAEQSPAGDQLCNEAAALVAHRCVFGAMAQLRAAAGGGLARLVEPRRDALDQVVAVFAARQATAGGPQRAFALEEQQHAPGAQQLGRRVDDELVQLGLGADRPHAQASLGQPAQRVVPAAALDRGVAAAGRRLARLRHGFRLATGRATPAAQSIGHRRARGRELARGHAGCAVSSAAAWRAPW